MVGQGSARRRRASRLHPVRLAVLTILCLALSGVAGVAAYFFPVVVAGVGVAGLIKLIDQLGGIDLFVTNPVLDDFYPDDIGGGDLYGYKRVAVLPGAQHLDGATALQYVRSRHNDVNGDFGRSARQQQVLLAIKAKASTLNAADLPDIVNALSGRFKTSMGLDRVRSLLSVASAFDLANVNQVVLYVPNFTSYGQISGQSVLLPHWPQILAVTRANFP